jgi:RNA polymerase sigma factor (sigma-70 family)
MASEQLTRVLRHIHHLATARHAEELSDRQALERFIVARDEAAFRALVQRHAALVWGVCRRVLRHEQDAEDAFQATFLVLARRAASIRKPESLGSWLYGVAYHLALEARSREIRRGTRERQVENMPQPPSPAEAVWSQLAPVLDEELQRLPDKYRRAVVLCYLEGKSHREAAEALGWRLGSVSKRLTRARELLRQNLTRRGLTLSGGILASLLTERAVPAAPGILVNSTVQAGLLLALGKPLAGVASAHALALFRKASRGLVLARMKSTTALLLLLGGLAFGVFMHPAVEKQAGARAEARSPEPAQSKPHRPPVANQGKKPPARPQPAAAEMLTVTGRVEDQAKQPLAGAEVVVAAWTADPRTPRDPHVLGQTKTDEQGQYRVQVKKPAPGQQLATLVRARGYGLGWNYLPAAGGAVIQLAPEQVLRIKLIDLQGQPAAGIKVHVCRLGDPPPPPLEHREVVKLLDTVDGAREAVGMFSFNFEAVYAAGHDQGKGTKLPALRFRAPPARLPVWPGPVTTDASGRLILRGLPAGQGIGLQVLDPRFAMQALSIKPQPQAKPSEITRVLQPARILEGTVVDAATAKPLAGALVRVPTRPDAEQDSSTPSQPSVGEMDWKGRWGTNGYRLLSVASVLTPAQIEHFRKNPFFALDKRSMERLRESVAPDELPRAETRTDDNGRYRLPLFVAGSYNVAVSGPGTVPYLGTAQTVAWSKTAATRQELKLSLSRGVRVQVQVRESPTGRPVPGARVDFWSPGSHLSSLATDRDGRCQALLPAGSWQLLVNCTSGVFVYQKVAAARVTGPRPTRVAIPDGSTSIVTVRPSSKDHFFYPDGWAAIDLKPAAGVRRVVVTLRRVTLRGRLLGPDGKPVARALLCYRHPMPRFRGGDSTVDRHQVAWKMSFPVRGEPAVAPVEVRDGKFEVPLCDVEAKYHLYFFDAQNQWGAVAEVSGKDRAPVVKMAACGSAKARLVDVQGKPRAGYRPLLWLLLPPGPHPAVPHSRWEGLAPDSSFIPPIANFHTPEPGSKKWTLGKVWWAGIDPVHYGKGFQTDARGTIALPALIAGATYRIFDPAGRAKDFTVEAGKTLDLGEVTVKQAEP